MAFRPNCRKPLPQPCAGAGARVSLRMQRGGRNAGMRLAADVDAHENDPGGAVVI
jgi:hypothetical protein